MTKENQQDDSFVILQADEATQSKLEALNTIRFGNNSLDKQFHRDIELISLAIVQCGQSEQDKIKADILLKSMLILFFGQVCFRHHSDQRFYAFDTLNTYFKKNSTLTSFPIAAILLHGSRALVEFPSEIAAQLMDWFIIDKSSWRYLATHGISALTAAEVVNKRNPEATAIYPAYKRLKEEKISGAHAAINLVSSSLIGLVANAYFTLSKPTYLQNKVDAAEHYGIDLALGGVGNQHFVSNKIIQNNGEHGHLYINFFKGDVQQKHSGLLLSIEQSAPGKSDQYGGEHDISDSVKHYSASGGDFFCKKPALLEVYQKDYRGLTVLPFANYYDSLWNFINEEIFILIKTNFEKCKCLLGLLAKETSLTFIKHMLMTPGAATQKDFDQLFSRYFQEIPQVKLKINYPMKFQDRLETLQLQIQCLENEKQQLKWHLQANLLSISSDMQLAKKTIQELSTELIHLREQEGMLHNENNSLLINLAQCFMRAVIKQMGCSADKSQKKNILLALQQKTQTEEMSSDLNVDDPIQYQDLIQLVSDCQTKKEYFISAKYKKRLYGFFYHKPDSKEQLADDKFSLVMQQIVYASY